MLRQKNWQEIKRIYRINQRVLKLPIECTMKQTNLHNQAISAAFTGHRFIPYDKVPSLRKALEASVSEHYNRGIRIFYCGMAMGFDFCRRNGLIYERSVFRHYIGCRHALS